MPSEPTPKQKRVLETIENFREQHNVSPSIAEIARLLKISRATTYQHMKALLKKGLLEHAEASGRTWRKIHSPLGSCQHRQIPLVHNLSATSPILSKDNMEGWLVADGLHPHEILFAWRVKKPHFFKPHILDGDTIIVRQQNTAKNRDIVLLLTNAEQIIFAQHQNELNLKENSFTIIGKVIEVRRNLA